MPIKSPKQYGLMQSIAHGGKPRKQFGRSVGPSVDVARKFISETPRSQRSKFAKALR